MWQRYKKKDRYNKKIPAGAGIFKNQKPKFMKPFIPQLITQLRGYYDKNRCKDTHYLNTCNKKQKKYLYDNYLFKREPNFLISEFLA